MGAADLAMVESSDGGDKRWRKRTKRQGHRSLTRQNLTDFYVLYYVCMYVHSAVPRPFFCRGQSAVGDIVRASCSDLNPTGAPNLLNRLFTNVYDEWMT
jgi:hypothetical protein